MTTSEAQQVQRDTEQALVAAVDLGNVIGFAERPLAAMLASHVRSRRGLTSDQARQAWRILNRYREVLARRGIMVPGGAARETRQEPAQQQPKVMEVRIGSKGRIEVSGGATYAIHEQLKIGLHAQWRKKGRFWELPASPSSAAGLLGLLQGHDVRASDRVRELAAEFEANLRARDFLDPELPVPELLPGHGLVNAKLWEHQQRGLAYLAASTATVLAVPMGGGKTAMAIAGANAVNARRAVIICPNKVRGVWPREIEKWSRRSWHIVDGKRPPLRGRGRYQDLKVAERVQETERTLFDCTCGAQTHAAVWNYEMLAHEPAASWVPQVGLDLLIADEGHRLKSPTGKISKAMAEWVAFTRRRWGLTGTPMTQYPWDIFGLYRTLEPGIFGTVWTPFKGNYIKQAVRKDDGREFPVAIKADRIAEFADKVHSIMYRPTIDLDLPPVTHITRYVELEPKARAEYTRLEDEMWADLSAFAAGTYDGEDTITPKNVLSRMMRLAQFTGGTVPNDEWAESKGEAGRKIRVSHAKEHALAEFASKARKDGTHEITGGLFDELGCVPGHPGGPEKLVIYAHFRDDLDVIKSVTLKAGLRYGEVSGRRSDGLNERSEMNPDIDVCAVQIQSGGTGVDLTPSRYGIWYSKGHSLGDYDQALKRQDRPGQTRPVAFIHLEVPDTIDGEIMSTLKQRRRLIAVSTARRGLDPSVFGVDDVIAPSPEGMDFDRSNRSGGAVVLPIDDYSPSALPPREAHQRRDTEGVPEIDAETMAQFELEGLL